MGKKVDDLTKLLTVLIKEEVDRYIKDDTSKNLKTFMEDESIESLEEIMKFRRSLTIETDRGCALIAVSFLDSELKNLIKRYLVNDTSVSNKMLGINGSLGTFSSRIDMVYLLGFIGKEMHRDLHIIRRIRNQFGHDSEPISFEEQSIQDKCAELYYNIYYYDNNNISPRRCFISAICGILGVIKGKMITVKHINPKKDEKLTKEIREDRLRVGKLMSTNVLKKVLDKKNN